MRGSKAISDRLNSADARELLASCCAATAWVEGMLARRPFADDDAVRSAATEDASRLAAVDWIEAFAAHPMIGDVESLQQTYAATKRLAANEQSGVDAADQATLAELAALNRAYFERFGFIFIVFAPGKSAEQMLALLRSRIGESREAELANAAVEQLKITLFRLEKLAGRPTDS